MKSIMPLSIHGAASPVVLGAVVAASSQKRYCTEELKKVQRRAKT